MFRCAFTSAVIGLVALSGCGGTNSTESATPRADGTDVTALTEAEDWCLETEGAAAVADLDGDGEDESIFVADPAGTTSLIVCGSDLVVAPFDFGGTNKPVQLYAIDVEDDERFELLVGTTTGAGPFTGTLLRLVDGEIVDAHINLSVTPPPLGQSEGESFGCVDVDDDGITDLVSVNYQLDASAIEEATTVAWNQTGMLDDVAGATRDGIFDIGSERDEAVALMNGTCRDHTIVVAVTDNELAAPATEAAVQSQTAADAQRDGVIAALANLPYHLRVDPLLTEPTDEGNWILSRPTREVIEASSADGCGLGEVDGDDPTEVICTTEYGEILLTDDTDQILRAYPMPGAIPSWIHITPTTIYAGRIGDGGLPDSTLVRIDRATLVAAVILIPAELHDVDDQQWPAGWRIASDDQATSYEALVGFAPEMAGTTAASWIGDVVINIAEIDALFD